VTRLTHGVPLLCVSPSRKFAVSFLVDPAGEVMADHHGRPFGSTQAQGGGARHLLVTRIGCLISAAPR